MTRGVLPSGWLGRWDGAARVEIYFVTIGGSDAGRKTIYGGKFTVSPKSTLQNPAGAWERSDGHPICGELDTSNKCDRVFSPQPPSPRPWGGVSQSPRQRRTNMASIREAVNTSRAAHSYSVTL